MIFLTLENIKKHPKKLHTYGSWEVFVSAALTAENNPELHFCFTNSFIQPSLVVSLVFMRCAPHTTCPRAVIYRSILADRSSIFHPKSRAPFFIRFLLPAHAMLLLVHSIFHEMYKPLIKGPSERALPLFSADNRLSGMS